MLRINFDFILWSNKKYISLFVLGTGQRIVGLPFLKKESTMNQTVDKLGLLNNGKEGERVALHGVLWPSWNPSNIESVGYRGVSGGPWNPLHCTAVMFEGFQECPGAPLYRTAVMFEGFQECPFVSYCRDVWGISGWLYKPGAHFAEMRRPLGSADDKASSRSRSNEREFFLLRLHTGKKKIPQQKRHVEARHWHPNKLTHFDSLF